MQKEQDGVYFTENSGDADEPEATTATKTKSSDGGKSDDGRIRGRWLFILILIIIPVTTTSIAAVGTLLNYLYRTLPIHSQLQNIEQSLVSKVYDMNGELIHEFSVERRFWVPLERIPMDLQNAVIAVEDRKFYNHWGIDIQRNVSALMVNLARGRRAQGASTITQQLARNLYLTPDKSLIRKLREVLTAIHLERHYTKKEILELYLNQAYLGAGAYGVQAAAERYYGKDVSELTLSQCAVIAGIIQLPERHRPDRDANIDRITARRNIVLRSMVIIDAITENAERSAMAEPVAATPRIHRPPQAPYFVEMVRRYVSERYGDNLLYNGGLAIHTTLDLFAQDSTERSVDTQVGILQRRLNGMFLTATRAERVLGVTREAYMENFDSLFALNTEWHSQLHDTLKLRRAQLAVASVDVSTGAIRVIVGGRDFQESRFNRATQARRQAGSAFKPYVYAAALDHGFTPATIVIDQPITLVTDIGEWRPTNYDNTFSGPMSIREALTRSNNLVAIQVFNRIGGQTVVDFTQRMGIRQPLHTNPSLAIGACEVIPLEITSSFGIFANRGVHAEPYFVQKIFDKNGRTLEEAAAQRRTVMSPQNAFLMNSMMSTVVCCGTAASIPRLGFRRPAAGKTGTTNEYSDAWFVGYTPQIATGVWAGIDERRSMGRGATGSFAAIPVWVSAMQALHRDLPVRDFARPEGVTSASVCAQTGTLVRGACPRSRSEFFRVNALPDTCVIHSASRAGGSGMDLFGPSRRESGGGSGNRRETLMF
ncbi:MAG: PBP1A family penicillin-binding protein [Chitinispirillales bacterium]|jgi:penicillin-binding protein 1A|nr:PBP1A family penicillin-binding protein [Chitinispirillales bacterium]